MSDPLLRNLRDPGSGTDATLLRVCWQAADEIERLRARIAELEKLKLAVEQHNRECDDLCNNAATCGYKQYFDAIGRRCTTCPVDMKINVTCNGSGHDT